MVTSPAQSDWLVNYAERHRAGQRVGTSRTEGTANFLVNRRMNKSQQMRWTRHGADRLLQVRRAVYNGTLGSARRAPRGPLGVLQRRARPRLRAVLPSRQRPAPASSHRSLTPNFETVPPV